MQQGTLSEGASGGFPRAGVGAHRVAPRATQCLLAIALVLGHLLSPGGTLAQGEQGFVRVERTLDSGDIQLDPKARRVVVDGEDLTLANREFDLLRFLMERPGEVTSRDDIMDAVWGSTDLRSSKTLDMHISWIRRKIGDDHPKKRKHIVTVRGVGFRFDP